MPTGTQPLPSLSSHLYWCGPLPPSGVAVNVTGTVAACGAVLSATSVTSLTVLEFAVVVGTGFAAPPGLTGA